MSDELLNNILSEMNQASEEDQVYSLQDSVVAQDTMPKGAMTLEQSTRMAGLSDDELMELQFRDRIDAAEDPVSEKARIQSAQLMSQISGDSFSGILDNYDEYANEWFGRDVDPVSARQAVQDAWATGIADRDIGLLSWQQSLAWKDGDEERINDLQAQIDAIAEERPPEDQARRGIPMKMLKGMANLGPIMLYSMAEGAKTAGIALPGGMLAGSLWPGVGTLAGGAAAYVSGQIVGSAKAMMEIEGGLTWYELSQIVDPETGEGLAPEIKFASSMIVGGVNAAIEVIPLDNVLDSLGITRAANETLRRTIKRGMTRFIRSDAYQAATKKVAGRIIGGTLENTGEEAIQQLNTIMWRELAIEINNSNLGTNIDHATMNQLVEEMEQTVLQSALGMGGISLVTGGVGGVGDVARARGQTVRTNKMADVLTELGYDVAPESGQTIEEKVVGTVTEALEDRAGRALSPIDTKFEGEGDSLRAVGVNTKTDTHSGSLEYNLDEELVVHITGAEFAGRSVEAKEIYKALVAEVGENNIVWELEGLSPARARLMEDAFSDEDFIVNMGKDTKFTDLQVTDRNSLRTNLQQAFKEFKSEEVDAAISLVEDRAGAMGMNADEFIKTYIAEDAFVSGLNMKAEGRNVRGVRSILAEGKAMFYLGKNANFETWAHEFGHVIRGTLSNSEIIDIETALDVEHGVWTDMAEEKFVDALLNYAEGKNVDERLTGPMSKVQKHLAELWAVAKKVVDDMTLTDEQIATYDRIFAPSQGRQQAAKTAEGGKLYQRTIVGSKGAGVQAEETSLGFGVRGYGRNIEAIEQYRNEQAKKAAKLTRGGELITGKPVFDRIAQDVLRYMNEDISVEELQRLISKRFLQVKQSFDNQAWSVTAEKRAEYAGLLEEMRGDLQELIDDVGALGVRIPQMGYLAVAETKTDNFLNFSAPVNPEMKQRLRKFRGWLTKNKMDWSKVVDIDGKILWFHQFDDFFSAIDTGTGADVYDALVRATGSTKNATAILADLGVTGGMAVEGTEITARTIYVPEDIDIIGNWTHLDKRSPKRFDLTVGELEGIRAGEDPAAVNTKRHLQLDLEHDTLIKGAGLWNQEIEDFYNAMFTAQQLNEALYPDWILASDEHKAKKVPNIQELEHFLQSNPEYMAQFRDAAEALGAEAVLKGDGLEWSPIERRMRETLRSGTEETVKGMQFSSFSRTVPQLLWDYMPNEKRERIRGQYVQAVERGFREPGLNSTVPGSFWSKAPFAEGSHWLRSVYSGIKTNQKTVGAFNVSSLCPMFQIGANGCYLDGCYVTSMATQGSRVNLYTSAFYAGDVLKMSQKYIDIFNDLGGLRINGTGDWYGGVQPIIRDLFRHAQWKGLDLKIITKQEATLEIMQNLINDSDADVAAKARDTVVQTTVDPYWIPVSMDLSPNAEVGSGADVNHIAELVERFHRESGDRKEQAFQAIQALYNEWGQAVEIKDGVIARKYGFNSDQIRTMSGHYPDVKVQPRAVVGTFKEIAEYALWAPQILQTWMHAKMGDSMYSDTEGRWLKDGEVGNFTLGNQIVEIDGELHVQGVIKKTGKVVKGVYKKLDTYLRENYSDQHQAILNVLKGHQDETASALCCQFDASPAECADCISLCHSRDSMKGQSLAAMADIGRDHRLFQIEEDPIPGDASFAEGYHGRTENGNPVPVWGDQYGENLKTVPDPGDLPYYITNPSRIATTGYVRPGAPGEVSKALRGTYPAAPDPFKPPGWSVEKYHAALGGLRPEKLTWAEQVAWIADQMEDLGFDVYPFPLPDGSIRYELSGPKELVLRMGSEYRYMEGMPPQLDLDVDFTPPGEMRAAIGPDWVNTLRGLARLVGKESEVAEAELDRRELQLWQRSQEPRLFQKDITKELSFGDLVTRIRETGVELSLHPNFDKSSLILSKIMTPEEKRGQGLATEAMNQILRFADNNVLTVQLTPANAWGSSVKRLTAFYKGFGFVENKGKNRNFEISGSMYREPTSQRLLQKIPEADYGLYLQDEDGTPQLLYHGSRDVADTLYARTMHDETRLFGTAFTPTMFTALRYSLNEERGEVTSPQITAAYIKSKALITSDQFWDDVSDYYGKSVLEVTNEEVDQYARENGITALDTSEIGEPGEVFVLDSEAIKGAPTTFAKPREPRLFQVAPPVDSDEFKAWFKESHVTTELGAPLPVYHGTSSDIAAFDKSHSGAYSQLRDSSMAFFFSESQAVARSYTNARMPHPQFAPIRQISENTWELPPLDGDRNNPVTIVKEGNEYITYEPDLVIGEDRDEALVSDTLEAATKDAKEWELLGAFIREEYDDPIKVKAKHQEIPVYLSLQNPLIVDMKGALWLENKNVEILDQAKKGGHDGVIFQNADESAGEISTTYAVFEPNQIKSIYNSGSWSPDDPRMLFQTADPVGTEAFGAWFQDSKVVDEDGAPVVMYHGTTHEFEAFDPTVANPENDFGKGIYLTNEPFDVAANYAGVGPDLTARVALRSEQLFDAIVADPEAFGLSEDATHDEKVARSEELANEQLVGGEERTIEAYVSLQDPVILEPGNREGAGTWFDYDEAYDEETEEYSEPTGKMVELIESVREEMPNYDGGDADVVVSDLLEAGMDYGGLTASEVDKIIRESNGTSSMYFNDELVNSGDLVRRVFERMGFDGIIDKTVNQKFGSQKRIGRPMEGMTPETFHVIAFKPTQVKSIENQGTFDPNDPRMLFQVADPINTEEFQDWFLESEIVDESGTPRPVYHGTRAEFQEMASRFPDGLVYFFTDPELAGQWAKTRQPDPGYEDYFDEIRAFSNTTMEAMMERRGGKGFEYDFSEGFENYDADRAEVKRLTMEEYGFGDYLDARSAVGARVLPVYLSIQKAFHPERDYALVEDLLRSMPSMEGIIENGHHKWGAWVVYENKEVIDFLKSLGYDGIWLAESPVDKKSQTIAPFNPQTQVKSVNNTGGFNPNDPRMLFQKENDEVMAEAAILPLEELRDLAGGFESVEDFKEYIKGEFADRDLSAIEDEWYEKFWNDHRKEEEEKNDAQSFLSDMQDNDVLVGFLDLFGENLAELGKQSPLVYVAARRATTGQKISPTSADKVREQFAKDPEFWNGLRSGLLADRGSDIFANTKMEDRVRIARSIEDPNDRLAFWRGELSFEETVIAHDQALAKLGVLEDKIEKGEKVAKEALAAAKKAVNEKWKMREYTQKLAKRITRKPAKACHWRFREAIEEIQNRFDPKNRSKGTLAAREMIQDLQDELGDHIVGDTRRSLNQFTIEELEALSDQVNALRKEGRAIYLQQQETKVERRKAMRTGLVEAMLMGEDPETEEFWGSDEKKAKERKGRALAKIRQEMDRPNRIFRFLDGDVENGNWHRDVWRRINEQTDNEIRNIDRRWGAIYKKMKELKIKEADFYDKKISFEGVTYSLQDVMFFYGADQNQKARAAVAFGVLTKDEEKDGLRIMQGFIDQLSTEHKQFVDYVLDQSEGSDWLRFRDVANDVMNVNPEKEPRYLALFRKNNVNQSFDDELKLELETRAGLGRHVPKQGMAQDRSVIKDIRQKPVRTDFIEVVRRSIEMQEHFIAFAGFTRDMIALQANEEYMTAMRQRWGQEGINWFKMYIDQIANPNAMRDQDITGGLARYVASGMGVAYLAYNTGTVLKQVSALPLYLGYASPGDIAKAAGQFAISPAQMWKKVSEMDPQLKHRVIDQMIERFKREGRIQEVKNLKLLRRGRAKIAELGFKPIEWVDMAVAAIGWEATYQYGLRENNGDVKLARDYAQDVMLKTQSAGRIKDLPQAYRTGGGFKRLFFVFSNQIHQMYQMMFKDLPAAAKQRNIRFLVMSAVGLAISMGFEGMVGDRELPDDPWDVPRWLGEGVIEKIPLVGKDVASGLRGWTNVGVSPFGIAADVAAATVKIARAVESGDWDGVPLSVWKTLDDNLAIMLGIPYSGPKKIINAIREGDPLEAIGRKKNESN